MISKNSKYKPLLFIILILLVANLAAIAFTYLRINKKPHREKQVDRKEMTERYLREELKFSKEQMARYEQISASNKKETDQLFDSLRVEKERRISYLQEQNYTDSAIDQVVNRTMPRQAELDRKMLMHIRNLRAICTEEQRQRFDTGFYKMMRRGRGDKKPMKK
jgi:protein CpxP